MNEAAEEMLLGAILLDNSILDEITLVPDNFLDLANRSMYQSMLNIKKKGFPIDAAAMHDDMGESKFFFIECNKRMIDYKECVPSVHAFKSYQQMIINQWKISKAKEMLQTVLNNDLTVDSVRALIKDLSDVDEEGTQEDFNMKEQLKNLYDMVTVPVPRKRSGIISGFLDIDDKTDGFHGNDYVIVGARPSMGKTAFLLNMAISAAKKSNAIPIIFSLEMKTESLLKRIMSNLGEFDGMKLKNPYHYLNEEEKERWINALGEIEKLDLKIYDKAKQTVPEMRAKVRKVMNENPGRKVIVYIDYLTKIKPVQNYKDNSHATITEISDDLKTMAKDFDIPVICLAQLSRGVEARADKRPMMSDLRESGSIEQDADLIMLLYRDEYYNETTQENRNLLEVNLAKNRDGETGNVYLRYTKEVNRIENLYHYHQQRQ